VGHKKHRLLLRLPHHAAQGQVEVPAPEAREDVSPDVAIVPALVLLVARDLLLFDPPRVLAWRFLHDPRLGLTPSWLSPLLPRPSGAVDRDPLALLLGATLAALAIAYAVVGLTRARHAQAIKGALLSIGGFCLVVAPTLAFVAMGFATDRPYGQDGGVVQLPLAMDRILAGHSPYGADYSDTMLGKQARVSDFWQAWGGNPILRHHAYLPGTHLLMAPAYLLFRATTGAFDPRIVTLAGFVAAALLAFRVCGGGARGLVAAAAVAVNPLVYWQQIFGANDVMVAALLLLAVWLAQKERPLAAAVVLGLACATKQLAWPYAPFLLAHLSGARGFRELAARESLRRLLRATAAAAATFALIVVPVAALDFRAFWGDIVAYNAGLPGADNYPLGGTPGFGVANFLIYFGAVTSLRDTFPFTAFYLLLIPLGLLLLRVQMHSGSAAASLATGSAALVASVYFSRVAHPNYLILAAILLPVGVLADRRFAPDLVVAPLLLFLLGVAIAEHEIFRAVWEDAVSVRLPAHVSGWVAAFLPRAGPGLTRDPLGLLFSALAAGFAIVWLWAGLLGLSSRGRRVMAVLALLVVVAVPTVVVSSVADKTGVSRGEDPWLARLGDTARPPVEAWSRSFRRDPPQPLDAGAGGPGEGILGRPRLLSVAALGLVTILLIAGASTETGALALAAVLLCPLAATGVVFGAGDIVALAGCLAFWQRRGRPLVAGLILGASVSVFPRLLFALPFLAASEERSRTDWLRLWGAAAGGFLLLSLPFGGVARLLAWPGAGAGGDGIGLSNLMAYWGGQPSRTAFALLQLLIAAACVLAARATRGADSTRLSAAGVALLAGLWVVPGASVNDLLLPLTLLCSPFLLKSA
jgi:hypothetical protein